MIIGFPLIHKNTEESKVTGMWGEEIIANTCCKLLEGRGLQGYTYKFDDEETIVGKYDVCVYMTHQMTQPQLMDKNTKNILWIQGFSYGHEGIVSLDWIYNGSKKYFHKIITSSRTLAEKYKIPFVVPPVDYERYCPIYSPTKQYDISFIGNIIKPIDTNFNYLNPMSEFNYRLAGGDMGKVNHDDWMKIVSESKINLHFGFKEGIEWDMVTGSPLFLASVGGFTMSDKVPWLMEKFGDSMSFTDGGADEIGKIKYYLEHEDERKQMAERAQQIARGLTSETLLNELTGG